MVSIKASLEKWADIKSEYSELYHSNECLSPYMSPEFIEFYLKYKFFGKNAFYRRARFARCEITENRIVIFPLLVGFNDAHLIGDSSAAGYTDAVYSKSVCDKDFESAISATKSLLDKKVLRFIKLNQESKFAGFMDSHYKDNEYGRNTCVNIPIPYSYEEYYHSLSKSVRQNYRTAKNRLSKENIDWKIEFLSDEKVEKSIFDKEIDLYLSRAKERAKKKNKKFNPVKAIYIKHFSCMEKATAAIENNFHACLYFSGELVAYMSGFYTCGGKKIVIPRLATDTERYGVYSPGTLLIFETVRYLIENTEVRDLDLSRGSERYKFVMGGVSHYNISYSI